MNIVIDLNKLETALMNSDIMQILDTKTRERVEKAIEQAVEQATVPATECVVVPTDTLYSIEVNVEKIRQLVDKKAVNVDFSKQTSRRIEQVMVMLAKTAEDHI